MSSNSISWRSPSLPFPCLSVGLMSGTSGDGIDVALVRSDGEQAYEFLTAQSFPYDATLRQRLLEAAQHDIPLREVIQLERDLAVEHAVVTKQLLLTMPAAERLPQVVGFHGHTIRHFGQQRLTWQIGDPSVLAQELGVPVVSDFRRRDLAAGGQGAPLAALFHREVLTGTTKPTAVVNIGGVANVTWIGRDDQLIAGDTGPGCGPLDKLMDDRLDEKFDRDGQLSSQGTVDQSFVEATLAHPFFHLPMPKSADRFDFNHLDVSHLNTRDAAATLVKLTTEAIVRAIRRLPEIPQSIWLAGGGSRNPTIVKMLQTRLEGVAPIEKLGLRSDSLEAECFAWLAIRRLRGLFTSLPETTGCREPVCGGTLTY